MAAFALVASNVPSAFKTPIAFMAQSVLQHIPSPPFFLLPSSQVFEQFLWVSFAKITGKFGQQSDNVVPFGAFSQPGGSFGRSPFLPLSFLPPFWAETLWTESWFKTDTLLQSAQLTTATRHKAMMIIFILNDSRKLMKLKENPSAFILIRWKYWRCHYEPRDDFQWSNSVEHKLEMFDD